MQTLPRGRLVPRQPRAIKRTTRTELRSESIHSGRYIHWNINITPTMLHCYNIRNGRCVHWNINITPTALRGENIHGDRLVHRDTGTTPTALHGCNIQMMRCFLLFHVQSLHKSADDFWLSCVFSEVFGELTCIIIVRPTLCYF